MRAFAFIAALSLVAACGDDAGQGPPDLTVGADDLGAPADLEPQVHWQLLFPPNNPNGPQPRTMFATAWDGQHLLLSGGMVASTGMLLNDFWSFNPVAKSWTEITQNGATSAPPARLGHGMAWTGSRLVLLRGTTHANGGTPYLNDVWSWDPTGGWVQDLPDAPAGPGPGWQFGVAWNGRFVVVYGGLGGDNGLWGYDPVAKQWAALIPSSAANPAFRISPALASRGGSSPNDDGGVASADGILFGGFYGNAPMNDVWAFMPGAGWSMKIFQGASGSPSGRQGSLLAWDGTRYLMLGGTDGRQLTYSDAWAYSPSANQWTLVSPTTVQGAPKLTTSFGGAWTGTSFLVLMSDSSVYEYTP